MGGELKKGDALAVARIAGIMAAKKTSELIPLCHPIPLTSVAVDIAADGDALLVTATAETTAQTGVEMEALTAASVAALTLYDMAKSHDRAMRITAVQLEEKSGGKSGDFQPMIPVDEAIGSHLRQAPRSRQRNRCRWRRRTGACWRSRCRAKHSQPPFDASAMDGYAVRAAEVVPGQPLKLAGTSQAGARFVGLMDRGQCVRIFTGAPLPIGADAVIIQEEATAKGNQVSFEKVPQARPERPQARLRLPPRHRAAAGRRAADAGDAEPRGLGQLPCPDRHPAPAHRRARHRRRAGGPRRHPRARPDRRLELLRPHPDAVAPRRRTSPISASCPTTRRDSRRPCSRAFDSGIDVLVTTGGASVGERDYVQDVLQDLGVELDFWKLRMRPGKPLMFGTRGKTLIFGLPGNPVSALVTATVILKPTLRALTGHADPFWPRIGVPAAQGAARPTARGGTTCGPASAAATSASCRSTPIFETDSSHASSLAEADALIVQPEDHPGAPPGEIVEVIPLDWD